MAKLIFLLNDHHYTLAHESQQRNEPACSSCPIAHALRELYPEAGVSVGYSSIGIVHLDYNATLRPSSEALSVMQAWDLQNIKSGRKILGFVVTQGALPHPDTNTGSIARLEAM